MNNIIKSITDLVLNDVFIYPLFLAVYIILIVLIIRTLLKREFNPLKKLLITLLTTLLAFGAYIKVSHTLDTWLVLEISDRCMATENRTKNGIITPFSINEGGNATAYMELVKIYGEAKKDSDLKEMVRNQLGQIHDNVERAISYVTVQISAYNNTKWEYKENHKGLAYKKIEAINDFDVTSIIKQLLEPNYWQTRLTSAKYLREIQYLKEIKNNEHNLELLKGKDYAKLMFNNLIDGITEDRSLSSRKAALDTFVLWACLYEGNDSDCKSKFMPGATYNFDFNTTIWKTKIIENFNKTLGLDKEATLTNN